MQNNFKTMNGTTVIDLGFNLLLVVTFYFWFFVAVNLINDICIRSFKDSSATVRIIFCLSISDLISIEEFIVLGLLLRL
jgi:hypothetical protein